MRFTAPLAALVLAAVAWVACWQQVQLVRLKRQIVAQAAPLPAPAAQPVRPTHRTESQLDRLGALLIERREAISDAREAASDFNIAEGTPEMDRAIALATRDLDQAIIRLAGPTVAAQLEIVPVRASIPADVTVAPAPAPMTPPVAPSPAPTYVYAPTSNVYVNVPAPAPAAVVVESAAADADPNAYAASQPIVYGGEGFGTGRTQRTTARHLTQAEQLKELTASAGIPLGASPAALVATTSPLLLMRQRSGSGATGR